MKISFNWLRELVAVEVEPQELARSLTMVGLAVDSVSEANGDFILDIDVTSNRPDCLNHLGVAREAAAIYGLELRAPRAPEPSASGERVDYSVAIRNSRLCRRYSALLISDITVAPSPEWMRRRLESLGMRPINNIVDITNYVLLELGHPLHAFDFGKLAGGKIIVRAARRGERIVTLDGVERQLDPTMLVIADAERPVAVAGVMGGAESEISHGTWRVLLESAYFDPISVRRTAKKLGLSTEASYRFERGADIEATVKAIARAAQLICEIAGGRASGDLTDVYPRPRKAKPITLRYERTRGLIGAEVNKTFVEEILRRLEFEAHEARRGVWRVLAPSHRVDIELEADLIEEVARHYGYDRVPASLPAGTAVGRFPHDRRAEDSVREALRGLGYSEAVSLSMVSADEEKLFRPPSGEPIEPLSIANPISEVDSTLRTSLLPGLLRAAERNFNHDVRNVRLYELGKVYFSENGEPCEAKSLGLILTGDVTDLGWQEKPQPVNFFHLKGALEGLFRRLGIEGIEFQPARDIPFLHPHVAAAISRRGLAIGRLGRLHPELEEKYKFKQPVFLAEVDIERLLPISHPEKLFERPSRFPATYRDVSFLVDNSVEYSKIERAILSAGIGEIVEVKPFDLYRGAGVPEGKKSLSLRLKYQGRERTLTQEEIAELHARVIELLRENFGAQLR